MILYSNIQDYDYIQALGLQELATWLTARLGDSTARAGAQTFLTAGLRPNPTWEFCSD